jgi:hypothetical protein
MYKQILVSIDLSDDGGWRQPLLPGAEHARKFGAQLTVLTVLREVEAIVRAEAAPLGYELFVTDLENKLAGRVREVNAYDLHPSWSLLTASAFTTNPCARQGSGSRSDHRRVASAGDEGLFTRDERRAGCAPRQLLGLGGSRVSVEETFQPE